MSDLRELLPLHALGVLEADEADQVERAVAADPALARELEMFREAAHVLVAAAPVVAPSPAVKARLLASVGGGPFERFSSRLAQMFDVTVDRARELLGLIEREASWDQPIPGLGVRLVHFAGGPACATADCGFVKIDAGCTFPWHTHRGREVSVILSGTLRGHDGALYHPGDEVEFPAGTQHDISAGAEPVIYVSFATNGIELGPRP